MAHIQVPESLPLDSQLAQSQQYDYTFEPTQLSQPIFSQTQNTQGTAFANSQVEPRRKYWAILIPTNAEHSILKIPWSKPSLQLGRGAHAQAGNDVVLTEKRVSNAHCRFTLGLQGGNVTPAGVVQVWKDGEGEPDVWVEDLGSSNGTWVNGVRIFSRRLLQHGDEISLGHKGTLDNHDVRYIFRSVGTKGTRLGQSVSKGGLAPVGEVYERYQFLDILGSGSFAEVRKAVDVETGDLRAIKQIVKHRFGGNQKTLELFQREIDICQRLQHENICRLIEAFEDPQHVNLVLEYIDGGDLLDHIMEWPSEDGRGLPEDHAATLTSQICSAMAYTHAMGVTHRDLKPENILLTKPSAGCMPIVKIADFGLAKMVHNKTMLVSMVGTPQYLAPEVVMQTNQRPGYENKVDCWSVGIIVYSMLTKALPFDEDAELPVDKRIKQRYVQQYDSNLLLSFGISSRAIGFISSLLAKEAEDRLSMAAALEHEWLAGPLSQQTESQHSARLGGDSQWAIQVFADDSFEPAQWTGPPTGSPTNLESAGAYASDESFSQPMGNLHINTPASRRYLAAAKSATAPLEVDEPMSPPSPPLTEAEPDDSGPGTGIKRKLPDDQPSAAFSSGSLSPPPLQIDGPKSESTRGEAGANKPRRGAAPVVPQRQSARMASRPRKSMKI